MVWCCGLVGSVVAEDMGVKSQIPAVPSICLGTASISLEEMLTVYSCYANSGYRSEPVGLLRIEDREGKVLYEYEAPDEKSEVLDEETVQMMDHMLKGVVERGTGKGRFNEHEEEGEKEEEEEEEEEEDLKICNFKRKKGKSV